MLRTADKRLDVRGMQKMKRVLTAMAASLLVQQISFAAVFSCPVQVNEQQESLTATNIWLYGSNPKEQALLKPYNGDTHEEPKYWLHFGNKDWSDTWYRCLYNDTTIIVDIKMEGYFTKCSRMNKLSGDVYLECE
jgi:hypothetical protein